MKITNKYNLPEPIYRAISQVWPPQEGRISVSDLIAPPLILSLKKKYWDQLEEDASERLWALLGQGLHYVLQKHTDGEYLSEERLKVEVYGTTITGRPDLYYKETIEDYKVTSVFSFLLGMKVEWEQQLNVYAFMFRHYGFKVDKLQISAILRDWIKNKAWFDKDYPSIPFQTIPVEIWTPERATAYVYDRIKAHKLNAEIPCTDIDRWKRPKKFAVKKAGTKRALAGGIKDTKEDAERFAEEYLKKIASRKVRLEIEERPEIFIRCKQYCIVRTVCPINPYKGDQIEEMEDEV